MLEELESVGLLDGFGPYRKTSFRKHYWPIISRFGNFLSSDLVCDAHKIVRIEILDTNKCVLFLRQYKYNQSQTGLMCWWLVKTEVGWRIIDWEDPWGGVRRNCFIAHRLKVSIAKEPKSWVNDMIIINNLRLIGNEVQSADWSDNTIREALVRLHRDDEAPDFLKRQASMMRVAMHLGNMEMDAAIEELEAANAGGFSSAIHDFLMGECMLRKAKYADALAAFELYRDKFGSDSKVMGRIANCYYEIGQNEEARAAALKGLEDNPTEIVCLIFLVMASSPESIMDTSLLGYFEKTGRGAWAYETVLNYLIKNRELEKGEALLGHFRKVFPEAGSIPRIEEALR